MPISRDQITPELMKAMWPILTEDQRSGIARILAIVEAADIALADFIRDAWCVVEPKNAYVHGYHIDALCEHLVATTTQEIRRLLITIPPRHMKSLTVCTFFPAWLWTWKPSTRFLFASYAQTLSMRDSVKTRRLITSPWYQKQWGKVFKLTGDQNMKTRFENDRTGYRIATSVGGSGTGEGGDYVVVDDPHKVDTVESNQIREGVIDWWDGEMSTRLDNPDPSIAFVRDGNHLHLHISVDNIQEMFTHVNGQGVTMKEPITDWPWGMREFVIENPDGHTIYFAQAQ